MSTRVVWQQRPSRHYRRYTNPARYPYLVQWGNPRLTTPAKMRTLFGAFLVAAIWRLWGRGYITISRRMIPEPGVPGEEPGRASGSG